MLTTTSLLVNNLGDTIDRAFSGNDLLFFNSANQLWITDGRASGTIALENSGISDAPIVSGDLNYFMVEGVIDDVRSSSIWRTDGTSDGTFELFPGSLTAHIETSRGLSFFGVSHEGDFSIWRTDGTSAGTFEISSGSLIAHVERPDGRIFLMVQQRRSADLLVTDGTGGNQVTVTLPGELRQGPMLTQTEDLVFAWHAGELWVTGGTEAGFRRLATGLRDEPVVSDDGIWFFATDQGGPVKLFRSVGTTVFDADIVEIAAVDGFDTISLGEKTLFTTRGELGHEIWTTDGTDHDTRRIASGFHWVDWGEEINGVRLFLNGPSHLWRTDGTEEGTYRLYVMGSFVEDVGLHDGRAYYHSNDFFQLVATDGTETRPVLSGDIGSALVDEDGQLLVRDWQRSGTSSVYIVEQEQVERVSPLQVGRWGIPEVAQVDDVWYAYGAGLRGRNTLHRVNVASDGDSGEVTLPEPDPVVLDVGTERERSHPGSIQFIREGNTTIPDGARRTKGIGHPQLFTMMIDGEVVLHALDGGAEALRIGPLGVLPKGEEFQRHYSDEGFFFERTTDEHGSEIWVTDGTAVGTQVLDLWPGEHSSNPQLLKWNGLTLILASSPKEGRALWLVESSPPIPGDLNGDSRADLADFLILSRNFGKVDATEDEGDLNGDGRVDVRDFLVVSANFGRKL